MLPACCTCVARACECVTPPRVYSRPSAHCGSRAVVIYFIWRAAVARPYMWACAACGEPRDARTVAVNRDGYTISYSAARAIQAHAHPLCHTTDERGKVAICTRDVCSTAHNAPEGGQHQQRGSRAPGAQGSPRDRGTRARALSPRVTKCDSDIKAHLRRVSASTPRLHCIRTQRVTLFGMHPS